MPPHLPTAIPIRPNFTRSTRFHTRMWTFARDFSRRFRKAMSSDGSTRSRRRQTNIGRSARRTFTSCNSHRVAVPARARGQADQARQPRSARCAGRAALKAVGYLDAPPAQQPPSGRATTSPAPIERLFRRPRRSGEEAAGRVRLQAGRSHWRQHARRLERRPRLSRASARNRDGAAALAAAQSAQRPASTSTPRRPSSIIGATGSTSTTAR